MMDGPIEMAALGRPFRLGMFYDCRSDKLIPGITLWDKKDLNKDMEETNKPSTEFKIVASESISDKSFSLGVEASLKASFLCGLVQVGGSAKYLNNNKTSSKQARVTLQYKATTLFKTLTMNQLGTKNITHSTVLEQDDATHVVTGILYGAQGFFVFDQEASENEKVQDIQGNLKVLIDKLPTIEIDGHGSLKIEDKDKESVKKFSCTFHGDFRLKNSPTTFEEAVKVYQKLPELLGPDGENAVPVTVWLYPLWKLDSRAAKLVRHISDMLVTEAQNMLEGFTELDMWCNDVLMSPAAQNFPHIIKNINEFKSHCSRFKLRIEKTLAEKLPSIRGGGEEEAALAEELRKLSESPFNRERLNQWTADKDEEVNTLETIMELMKNTETVASRNDLSKTLKNSKNALVFVLTCLESAELFLSELKQYPKETHSEAPEPKPWYRSKHVIDSLKRKAKLFSDFAEANKDSDKKDIQFLAVGLADENHEVSTIYLYENGFKGSEDFEPPSKPKSLTVDKVTHNTVSLTFSAPSDGLENIHSYRLEFSEKGQKEWNFRPQPEAGRVTVSGLKPNTEYSVRVRAVTAVGVGPAAETSTKTLPCGPPEDLRATVSVTDISVSWRTPVQVGEGVHIQNYIVEFGQTQENIQWKTEESQSERKVISGLRSKTNYTIRLLCDCGESGKSVYSSTITVSTTDYEDVTELVRRLHLQDTNEKKMTISDLLQIKPTLKAGHDLLEKDLRSEFLYKLWMLDYRARYVQATQEITHVWEQDETEDFFEDIENMATQTNIHPMDLQMAVFHCSDSFLKQMIATKLSQCQYALPLLVPDAITGDIECPLWTFRQIQKTWKKTETINDKTVVTMKSMSICKAETPMVLCFRLGSLSVSKSQLISSLINDRHNTFFHRNCPGSTKTRLQFDGVTEIAWYCPAGKHDDSFTDCVAFCNLHGDGLTYGKQLQILMDRASVCVVFVPTLDRRHDSAALIKLLLESPKPLIALIENNSNNAIQRKPGKYTLGLKDRSLSDVSHDLKKIIRHIASGPHESFQLQSMSDSGLRVDEHDFSCKRGFDLAKKIMTTVKSFAISDVKKKLLPYQGQPWHDWSRKQKGLYHLKGNIEDEKSKMLRECQKLREDQCKNPCSELIKCFVQYISTSCPADREHFLKWTEIQLSDHTTDSLFSVLQSYNKKWSEVLDLKKQPEDPEKSKKSSQKKPHERSKELQLKQDELAKISQEILSGTCGLEHIFREMGQIYEAHKSLNKPVGWEPTDWSKYPALAAELMISGHPMELMDGDAGHVPLIWVKSLIDHVVHRLGNKRVFVLSVLGIQSSGKSTMLNAMFGVQFAVSAGRCTRGAFMQLIKLSEDFKKDFQWDYILVVDTEGLRALELEGNQTIHHDNELATFVVGLGNMTLVNIFGENPSEMQDILQIVVQAFMRMKKVKLSPSCVFVHQNVTDVSAAEKNMDGRRKLLEKLDAMVRLAAKEEVCDAESFSDIIEFDVQKDVKYFAQLWEGSPPMAPPNPGYSDSVRDLKSFILEKAKTSPGVSLFEFGIKVEDLWNALLNENFVFSFKNTLEITVYRKLEVQYGNWTWALRSEMLKIEEDLYRRINNRELDHVDVSLLHRNVAEKYKEVKRSMSQYFADKNDKEMLIQWRAQHELKIQNFLDDLSRGLQRKLTSFIEQKKANKDAEKKKTVFENNLLAKSKKLALELKDKFPDDQELRKCFEDDWRKWVSELTRGITPPEKINLKEDQIQTIQEHGFEMHLILSQKSSQIYKKMLERGDYTDYTGQKRNDKDYAPVKFVKNTWNHFVPGRLSQENQEQIKELIKAVEKKACKKIKQKPVKERGYSSSYLREISSDVLTLIVEFESQWKYPLKKEFKVDLILFVFERTESWILECHSQFIKNNDVLTFLQSKKDEYYSVFSSFCKGSSTTVILAEVICEKLKVSMTEAVCDKTANNSAIDIAGDIRCTVAAFKENKLNLEKHILKSLAEKRDFQRYREYISDPKTYTETFIREEVENLIQSKYKDRYNTLLKKNIFFIQKLVVEALEKASETNKVHNGDIDMWLQTFTESIKGELTFGAIDPQNFSEVNNFDFLKEEIEKGVKDISADLTNLSVDKLKNSRQRPDQILIDQLCDCCWETCPFCSAVCTHSVKDHDGDHSTPFHRSASLQGWHYSGTNEMSLSFCTTNVASDTAFKMHYMKKYIPFKSYKDAGPPMNSWTITPQSRALSYWQWVVCTFQKEIEEHYKLYYKGRGEILKAWRDVTDDQAKNNLEELYK